MCKYCEDMKSFYYSITNNYIQEVYIEKDGSITIACPTYFNEEGSVNFEINYCPICGKKLIKS